MQALKIVRADNLNNIELGGFVDSTNTIFITATKSMKYSLNDKLNVLDAGELYSKLLNATKEKECLKESEMKYILFKTISSIENSDSIKSALLNSVDEVYSLFSRLLISGIDDTKIDINNISNNQLKSSYILFDLYNKFLKELESQNKQTFHLALKKSMQEFFACYEKVVFVGFTFLNDIQNQYFEYLIKENKLSTIIINNDKFLIEEWLKPLLAKHNVAFECIEVNNDVDNLFNNLRDSLFTKSKVKSDYSNAIEFIDNFPTREMELGFIVDSISNELREYSTRQEIVSKVKDFAIVMTHKFSKHALILNELFKRKGVFISKDDKIYYSLDEYLETATNTNKQQLIDEFSSFDRLEVYTQPKRFFNSRIGRVVDVLYKISWNGINVEDFSTLLNINIFFKEIKQNDVVSSFDYIECFFEELESITQWQDKIKELKQIKATSLNDDVFASHPLKSISSQSLEYIEDYIQFISNIVNAIKTCTGGIRKHISALYNALKNEPLDEELEKEFLAEFNEILSVSDDGFDIDQEYFARNFRSLIAEYTEVKKCKNNNILVHAINLESISSYKTVFVPMFENNKYPLKLANRFPLNSSVIEILKDNVDGYSLPLNLLEDYNLNLSNFTFTNLFRIAKEKVVFTKIKSEDVTPLDWSIFAKDIMKKCKIVPTNYETVSSENFENEQFIFVKESKDIKQNINELLQFFVCPKMYYYALNNPALNTYNDKFLITFYCKSLIYNLTLKKLANGKIYNKLTIFDDFYAFFNEICEKTFNLLPIFNNVNKNDIVFSSKTALLNFLNNKILTGRYSAKHDFTLTLGEGKRIEHNGSIITTWPTLILTDVKTNSKTEFDISKSLDIPISSSGGTITEEEHFSDIVEELYCSNQFLDRAYSLNYLSFKVNTQLSSQKFVNDGIKRVNSIIDTLKNSDNTNLVGNKSSYCSFCKFKHICLGGVDNE